MGGLSHGPEFTSTSTPTSSHRRLLGRQSHDLSMVRRLADIMHITPPMNHTMAHEERLESVSPKHPSNDLVRLVTDVFTLVVLSVPVLTVASRDEEKENEKEKKKSHTPTTPTYTSPTHHSTTPSPPPLTPKHRTPVFRTHKSNQHHIFNCNGTGSPSITRTSGSGYDYWCWETDGEMYICETEQRLRREIKEG
ncbi:hypothetical protein SBOR_4332 [Sclerotinia borealis F-4128]|uniref:Uncharacterized protein n=1 Tax=Sclerotinia borealis (strain F-4128) TaxID=1432307 RepID=W9CH48_SCLBF|nr:hypothetical protein SBOR_4332 [Sclerotinia borealis F-4128]